MLVDAPASAAILDACQAFFTGANAQEPHA